jgi:aerobic carbon-monoxide dehydrogenase large subunit
MTTAIQAETLLGKPIRRVEDASLLTGEMQFLDDLKLPGMAFAAVLRSPYAHARISAIDTTKAAAYPGVIAVYTGKDFEDLPPLPCAWQAGGVENFVNTPRVLEIDRVTLTGAGVAVVVAENRYLAEDALGLIDVDYEPLETVVAQKRQRRRVPHSCTRTLPATSRWTGRSETRTRPRARSGRPTSSCGKGSSTSA